MQILTGVIFLFYGNKEIITASLCLIVLSLIIMGCAWIFSNFAKLESDNPELEESEGLVKFEIEEYNHPLNRINLR